MEIPLVIFYALLLGCLLTRLDFCTQSGLSKRVLWSLLGLKIGAALAYGYIHRYVYGGADTWMFINASRLIYNAFYENPLYFLELVFGPNARPIPAYLAHIVEPIPAWSDTRTYTILRINAVLHFFSFGYYGVHAVFWAFGSLIGLLGIYQTFIHYFSNYKKRLFVVCFLVPSVVFWGSGIHKEGVTFFCLGLLLHHFRFLLARKAVLKRVGYIVLFLLLLILVRYYVALLLLPALCAWGISYSYPYHVLGKYLGVYTILILIVVLLNQFSAQFNVFERLVATQHYYIAYKQGRADIFLPRLEANICSITKNAPTAACHTIFRPTLLDARPLSALPLLAALETFLFTLLLLFSSFFGTKKQMTHQELSFWYFCLFFALSYLIFVGLIVDNLGALVRYRTVALPFFLGFFVLLLPKNLPFSFKKTTN